jgi:hypothetical protein
MSCVCTRFILAVRGALGQRVWNPSIRLRAHTGPCSISRSAQAVLLPSEQSDRQKRDSDHGRAPLPRWKAASTAPRIRKS